VDFTQEIKTGLSLCTGMRGLERGLERAGLHVRQLALVEIEAFVIENLVQQMEQGVLDETPVWSNLKTFDPTPFRGMVDIITGGYPCQPFSVAGNQKGIEDPRHLWPYIFNIVRTVRPLCVFFENVPGHIIIGYREVRSQLQSLGYQVEQGIFSAEEVGAPHQRKRLFILAVGNSHISEQNARRRDNAEVLNIQEQERSKISTSFSARPSDEVDHTGGDRSQSQHTVPAGRNGTEYAGEDELAYSEHNGQVTTQERGEHAARERSSASRQSNGEQLKRCSTEEMADSIEPGLEGLARNGHGGEEVRESGSAAQGSVSRWPSRPGEEQYEWEAPRVEPKVGFTAHGYNFREDLLRLLGNGVVEQTAELAWRTLIKKFHR
jgi:DNA (cytosine-5)-methyltransferase 1